MTRRHGTATRRAPLPACALAAALATLCAGGAFAQAAAPAAPAASVPDPGDAPSEAKSGKLQSFTVTAERKVKSIQKTSIAVEAVTGSEIAEQGLTSGAEILKNISNVEVQGAARGNVIAIRGIGSDLPPGMGESAVSTNYDGVYNFRAEMGTLGFFDLDRVEVLRGPQGTLYGRNAAAGAVSYLTRDPRLGGRTSGNVSLEVGDHGLFRGEFGANVPVNDMLAVRISGASVNRDGYLSDGFNDAQASGVRVKTLFQPSSGTRLVAAFERIKLGGKGPGFIPQANWNDSATRLQTAVHPTAPGLELIGYQDYVATKTWLQLDQDVGFATLTLIPAHQKAHGVLYRKYDASRPPGSEEQYNADPAVARQQSVEARLSSKTGSALEWVGGVYWYDMLNAQHCLANISCAGPGSSDTTTSKAVFGQVIAPLAPGLRAVAGLRHTRDNKTALGGIAGDWSSTDGKLGVEFDLSNSAMGYLTYATAYRPGGFNSLPGGSGIFEAEKLKSVELGLKSRWLDDTLQVNGALFRYDYRNYQAVDFAFTATGLVANFRNVPEQTIQGFEIDTRAQVGAGTALRLAFNFIDAKLGDLLITNFDNTTSTLKGLPLPHAPRTSLKLGAEHELALPRGDSVTLRADARRTARQYVSINENADTLQPAYSQVDLSAQYRSADDKWGLNLYVKNATDYVPKVANFGGYTMVGAPRTVGAVLTAKF